jgi:FlaG/FlaF family flagellin (archaellin)
MRSVIVLAAVLASVAVGASSAVAAPTPADRGMQLCERQGGTPSSASADSFTCDKALADGGFNSKEVSQAAQLCDRLGRKAGGRSFGSNSVDGTPVQYSCTVFS